MGFSEKFPDDFPGDFRAEDYQRIVFLTGAGISKASGLNTYRGEGGLWEQVKENTQLEAAEERPEAVWELFGELRQRALVAEPNPAHLAIHDLERRLGPRCEITVITQNVDGLHQKAGSQRVIELHGSIHQTRCNNPKCDLQSFADERSHAEALPSCPVCGASLRPNVVMFGEAIPAKADHGCKQALRDCELFIAVGTSGAVSPASNFVRSAEYEGARTILVNKEPMKPRNPAFEIEVLGLAELVLPELLGVR